MKNNKIVSIRMPAKLFNALKDLEFNVSKECRKALENLLKNKKAS